MNESKTLTLAPTLSLQQYLAPLEKRLQWEMKQVRARQRSLTMVSLIALLCLTLGAGITYTALQHTLTPVLAILCGLMLHGMIALALCFYMDGKQERRASLATTGMAIYGISAFILLLIAIARMVRLQESHPWLMAASISGAIYLMEMLLATGAGYWLHLVMTRWQAAQYRMQQTQALCDSLIAAPMRDLWWERHYLGVCQMRADSALRVDATYGDDHLLARSSQQAIEAELRWIEQNAPIVLARPEGAVTERVLHPGAHAGRNSHTDEARVMDRMAAGASNPSQCISA